MLVGLTLAIFARGLRGPAVAVTVVDDAVVRWLAGLVGPGLMAPLRGLARIGSWWALYRAYFGLLLALLVLRRWRHLLVWWVAFTLGSILTGILMTIARQPRPFGVDLQASWGGWAMPSVAARPASQGDGIPPGPLRFGSGGRSSREHRPGDLLVIGPAVTHRQPCRIPTSRPDGALTGPPLKLGWPAPAI